jgi:hypothetical protein
MFGQMAPMGTGAFDVALDMDRLLHSPRLHRTEAQSQQTFPTVALDRVPITLVRCHPQLLATARVH